MEFIGSQPPGIVLALPSYCPRIALALRLLFVKNEKIVADTPWMFLLQLLRQFPYDFEFNERFLELLVEAVYSCQFGNFLFNRLVSACSFLASDICFSFISLL